MFGLEKLFTGGGTAYTLFYLAVASLLGVYIGKISFFGIRIGIAGVLFSGLLLGALGVVVNPHVLHFVKEFGLVLFVFTIGIQVGPGFFRSLRSEGLKLNLLAAYIVGLGVAIAAIFKVVLNVPVEAMVGVLSGAVTNTPGLGAAQQSLSEQVGSSAAETAGAAYAVAYPFGIMGIIISVILIKILFKVKIEKSQKEFEDEQHKNARPLEVKNLCVKNPKAVGMSVKNFLKNQEGAVTISRVLPAGSQEVIAVNPDYSFNENDVFLAVGSQENLEKLALLAGEESSQDLRQMEGRLVARKVVISKETATKQPLGEFNLRGRYHANLTRVVRAGVQFAPSLDMTLHLGDVVTVVSPEKELDSVVQELGDSQAELYHPNLVAIFFGIALGLILGSVAVAIPGLPAPVKLGMAGGPLVIALIMGRIGKIGPLHFYLHPGANYMLREVGIVLFLACVGLGSGKSFIPSLTGPNGVTWLLMGMTITFIPVFSAALIARLRGINYLTMAGALAGSMTDPPALGYANSLAKCPAQSVGYASVYPLTMLLRIMSAQLFVLLFL